jgi:Effector protein
VSDPLLIRGFQEVYNIELYAEGLDSKHPQAQPLGSPEAWGLHVQFQLGSILSSDTGRLLLEAIKRDGSGRWVRIIPWAYFKNHGILWDHTCKADALGLTLSTGGGKYAVEVRYSPHLFAKGSYCVRSQYPDETSDRAAQPHEVLFHELVHAYRYVSGKHPAKATRATGGLWRYDNAEEFFAVLITNIYISDPSTPIKSGLRRDHQGHQQLEKDLASSFKFFNSGAQTFEFIDRLCKDHKQLTSDLCKTKSRFNPLAAYYHDPVLARKMSHNRTAATRDVIGHLPIPGLEF